MKPAANILDDDTEVTCRAHQNGSDDCDAPVGRPDKKLDNDESEQRQTGVDGRDEGDGRTEGGDGVGSLGATPRSLMGRMLRNGTSMLDRQRVWAKDRSRKVWAAGKRGRRLFAR